MPSKQHIDVVSKLRKEFPFYNIIEEYHVGQRLFLDIYIPSFSCGIEINGMQHYEFSPFFHGTEQRFEEYKMLDRKKYRLCADKGIGIFVVKYNEEFCVSKFYDFAMRHMENMDR